MSRKWVYWPATTLLSLMYLAGAFMYASDLSSVQTLFVGIGYPAYLVPILGILKVAGAVTILARYNVGLSDLAYAGMFFHLLLAASAHINAGDGQWAPAFIGIALLLTSFFTQNDARTRQSPYGGIAG